MLDEALDFAPELLKAIFGNIYVTYVDGYNGYGGISDLITYYGFSPMFEKISIGEVPPDYEAEVTIEETLDGQKYSVKFINKVLQ